MNDINNDETWKQELEDLEIKEITQPVHLIILQLVLKVAHCIHNYQFKRAYQAAEQLKREMFKYLVVQGKDIKPFRWELTYLLSKLTKPFGGDLSTKARVCHRQLIDLVRKMSQNGFDFIVIMDDIETQDDIRKAINRVLINLSSIDPYFELREDIGTAEVVKQNLRKLDKLLSKIETADENIAQIVDASRIAIKNYDRIMSTIITGGIGTTGLMELDITGSKSKKAKVFKEYLTVKKAYSEILIILEIVLEKPERAENLWKDISEMAKETPKSTLPFGIHISPRESRGETSSD